MNSNLLRLTPLFRNFSLEETECLLKLLNGTVRNFSKGERIYSSGQCAESFCLVLKGRVCIEINDFWGSKSIIDSVGERGIFAESYAISPDTPMMVDVTCTEDSEILFLSPKSVFGGPESSSKLCVEFVKVLLEISVRKNLALSSRIMITSPKSLRGKITLFLSSMSKKFNSDEFEIPFDRQQLADYLGADRSALSLQLSKMREEGLIEFHKNKFTLKSL